jgi:hypothetical protein
MLAPIACTVVTAKCDLNDLSACATNHREIEDAV